MGEKVISVIPLYPKYDYPNLNVLKLTFLVGDITELSEKLGKFGKVGLKLLSMSALYFGRYRIGSSFLLMHTYVSGLKTWKGLVIYAKNKDCLKSVCPKE